MATARECKSQEAEEEEGSRTAGKYTDQRFFRKSPEKPYDRQPTTLIRTSEHDSWILKLVDPAQRLLSSGSQMLFSSAFRNFPHRLTSRTSSQVAPESSQSRKDDKKADGTDPFEAAQLATDLVDNRNKSDRFGMMELEKTLKQKTFTRSEIDQFTTLLHSRNVDLPVVNEEKKFEFISSVPDSNRKEFVKLPNSEVKMDRKLISTPILSSSVLDEDISSPAEIARAYMGSRQPNFFPSKRSLRAQGLGENSTGPTSISFSSKSTDVLLVPSSTSQGFKRRSSFFDSHIGSIVPSRRIRQKRSIHLSKGLSLPVSARPISVPVAGFNFGASQSFKFGKVQHCHSSIGNVASDNIPGAGSSSIYTPSRSYKIASKILEQLDKLTPPKEKVPTFNQLPDGEKSPPKLIPFTVGGHLRSVKDVDLPRSEEFVHYDKQSNSLHGISYHGYQDHTFQNKKKLEDTKPLDLHHKCALLKDSGSLGSSKDFMDDLGVPASAVVKSTIQPPENEWEFRVWPYKDSADHDESSPDRVATATTEVRDSDISFTERQTTASEALGPAKPQTTSEVVGGSPLNRSSDFERSDDSSDDDTYTRFTFQNASSLCMTLQPETVDSVPTDSSGNKDLPDNKQIDSPVCSFGYNVSPRKQPNASSTAFDVGNKDASPTESRPASSYSDVQESVYLNADISSNHKLDHSWGTYNDAFSFTSSACNQSLSNGTSISCPSLFSSYSSAIVSMSQNSSGNIFLSPISSWNGTNITTTDDHPLTTNLAPLSAPSATSLGTYEDKIKQDASLNNANDTYFNSISTPANSHYSTFSFGAAATPLSVNNQLSTTTVSSATDPSAQEVSVGKGFIANAERTAMVLGSSMLHVSPGTAGKASISCGVSFGSSFTASELFNSGSRPSDFPITGFTSTIGTSNVSTSSTCLGFESSTRASFNSIFPTTLAATLAGSSSKPVSSNSHPKVALSVSSGNNDCEEQGISEDNVSLFSQKPIPTPSSGFSFGPVTSELNPFQVGKQETLAEPQKCYPHMASFSSLEAKAGGSFSLSAGRGNKASRRFVKIKRKK